MKSFPYLSNKYTAEGEVGRRNCYQQTSGRAVVPVGWIFLSRTPEYRWISFVTVDRTKKLRSKSVSFGACEAKTNYVVGVIIKTIYLSLSSLRGDLQGIAEKSPEVVCLFSATKLHRFSCWKCAESTTSYTFCWKKMNIRCTQQKWFSFIMN